MSLIAISAGHYPARQGVKNSETTEWREAMVWASVIARNLPGLGYMVPTGTLREKVGYINQFKDTKLAVEIHFNDLTDGHDAVRGSESLYYPGSEKGKRAAEMVQDRLGIIFSPNRGAKEGWYRLNPENGPDFFLAQTNCPAIIVEMGFFDHIVELRQQMGAACLIVARALAEIVSSDS